MQWRPETVSGALRRHHLILLLLFFFNDPATTEIYTLSLHDALPISLTVWPISSTSEGWLTCDQESSEMWIRPSIPSRRSEEHTSELQSHSDLVCRLLLEKKKYRQMQCRDPRHAPAHSPRHHARLRPM